MKSIDSQICDLLDENNISIAVGAEVFAHFLCTIAINCGISKKELLNELSNIFDDCLIILEKEK